MFTRKSARLLRLRGAETARISPADTRTEYPKVLQLRFPINQKTIKGARAMLCGLAKTASVNAATESFGFDSNMNKSDKMRKKVYIASNCPQTDPLKIVAGLKV